MSGIIYILSNPAMPGILKIGKTTQDDIKTRIAQLYSTGVPLPFECVYAATVANIDRVEQALHIAFGPNRINPKREFFEIEAIQAISIIKLLEIENISVKVENEPNVVNKDEIEAGKVYSQKRPRLNFAEMGIPIGSELVAKEGGEIATVVSERTIRFRDAETSLTNATRLIFGLENYSIAPGPYWTYNGRTIRDIYDDTYQKVE